MCVACSPVNSHTRACAEANDRSTIGAHRTGRTGRAFISRRRRRRLPLSLNYIDSARAHKYIVIYPWAPKWLRALDACAPRTPLRERVSLSVCVTSFRVCARALTTNDDDVADERCCDTRPRDIFKIVIARVCVCVYVQRSVASRSPAIRPSFRVCVNA